MFAFLQIYHYVEKPETFVSTTINCGIYLFDPQIFEHIGEAFNEAQTKNRYISINIYIHR